MRSLRRAIVLVAVNLVVLAAAAELLSLGVYYYQHGWLFYADPYRQPRAPLADVQAQRLTGEGLHPYFGQTHRPGVPFEIPERLRTGPAPRIITNNFGFAAPHDYPYSKSGPNQTIVGIFGGSVGVWFCQLGVDRLLDRLRQDPAFRQRELVPLCFAHEGYKQPQQLLVLSYFLSIGQTFDVVVNIDGFNEVALGRMNEARGLEFSMPSAMHLDPLVNLVNQATLTPAKLDALARISRARTTLNALAARVNHARLASVYLILDQYAAIVESRYRAARVEFDGLPSNPAASSLILVTPKGAAATGGDALPERVARQWAESSSLMQQLLAARSVPYVHVLQPNQYFGSRVFSAAEARIALNDASPFKPGVADGYRALLHEADVRAMARHETFVDATTAFDRTTAQVYLDDCCHYTVAGNALLADVVADAVLRQGRGPARDGR